jgi:PAS domain S-box-containing protein
MASRNAPMLFLMEPKLREHRHRTGPKGAPELRESLGGQSGGCSQRILLVDDNPDDRALVTRELRREMPELVITEIADEEALDRALEKADFDLVITDYELYWGDGLEIVDRVKEKNPQVPILMFTGSGSEEIAVEAMKAGVLDYITKDPEHFSRLRTSVQQAFERLRYSVELARAEQRYKELFDAVPIGLFRCTPQGQILDANPAFLAMTGLPAGRDSENNFKKLHADPNGFKSWQEKLERDGAVTCVESHFKTPDGSSRWIQIHAKAVRDPETGNIIYEGSVEDISHRKQADADREHLIGELRDALGRVKSLTGLLPICSSCKKIRDTGGRWTMLESFIENHSQAHFTHSFCPDCARKLYPEVFLDRV